MLVVNARRAASLGTSGSLIIDDGDRSEDVTFKMNSRFFKLCRVYSNPLKMSNKDEFPQC